MTTRALSKRPRKYILKDDRGKADTPVFSIRSVDIFELAEITNDEIVDGVTFKATLGNLKEYLKKGLLGWENLKDTDTEIVSFSQENFTLLPINVISELVAEISGQIRVEEEKNSDTPSSSQSG